MLNDADEAAVQAHTMPSGLKLLWLDLWLFSVSETAHFSRREPLPITSCPLLAKSLSKHHHAFKLPAALPRLSQPVLLVRPVGLVEGAELPATGALRERRERLRIALRPTQVDAMDHHAQMPCECTLLAIRSG